MITPELKAVLEPALKRLLKHRDLAHLRDTERSDRVLGVGSVLLQLLDAQQQLNEPLDLNGDLLADLLDSRFMYWSMTGDAGISAMFASVSSAGPEAADHMLLKFKSRYVVWDDEYCPPAFRCDDLSRSAPTEPIPVVIKRKGAEEVEGELPSKCIKRNPGQKPVKVKLKLKAKPVLKAPKPASLRRLRSRNIE